jgi:hypothetical protein
MNIKFVEEYLKNIEWNIENDQWQVSTQVLSKLTGSGNRVGIDAGVVASRK